MNLFVQCSKDIPFLLVPDMREALLLLSAGFLNYNPDVRLFYLEKEKTWLPVAQIWETLSGNYYLNGDASTDYI